MARLPNDLRCFGHQCGGRDAKLLRGAKWLAVVLFLVGVLAVGDRLFEDAQRICDAGTARLDQTLFVEGHQH